LALVDQQQKENEPFGRAAVHGNSHSPIYAIHLAGGKRGTNRGDCGGIGSNQGGAHTPDIKNQHHKGVEPLKRAEKKKTEKETLRARRTSEREYLFREDETPGKLGGKKPARKTEGGATLFTSN